MTPTRMPNQNPPGEAVELGRAVTTIDREYAAAGQEGGLAEVEQAGVAELQVEADRRQAEDDQVLDADQLPAEGVVEMMKLPSPWSPPNPSRSRAAETGPTGGRAG
jgi:hypothetical protein